MQASVTLYDFYTKLPIPAWLLIARCVGQGVGLMSLVSLDSTTCARPFLWLLCGPVEKFLWRRVTFRGVGLLPLADLETYVTVLCGDWTISLEFINGREELAVTLACLNTINETCPNLKQLKIVGGSVRYGVLLATPLLSSPPPRPPPFSPPSALTVLALERVELVGLPRVFSRRLLHASSDRLMRAGFFQGTRRPRATS